MPSKPGLTTIKTLFALSCNRCAFPGCDQRLTDPAWSGVKADIAHIRGEKPGAARYAPDMTDEDRHAVDNLMLMCPNHHRVIDRLEPQDWSAARLMEIKIAHESGCEDRQWAHNEGYLEHLASTLLSYESERDIQVAEPPRLRIEDGPGDTFEAVNFGSVDAFNVRVENVSEGRVNGVFQLEEGSTRRLSPGGRARAGLRARTMGGGVDLVVRLSWEDGEGRHYDGDFPL